MKGTLEQKGDPLTPDLVVRDVGVVGADTPGASLFASMKRNERRRVYYELANRRVAGVAESPEALAALLAAASPSPSPSSAPPRSPSSAPPRARQAAFGPPERPRQVRDGAPRPFHNPYNFVPFVPRPEADAIRALPTDPALRDAAVALADGPPPGHDRWLPDRWHGRLDVTLTVVTPLLLPDAARWTKAKGGRDGHRLLPVQERDGRPEIAGSSLKGALRSAYEALTNSRLPRFDAHGGRLGYRRPAGSALGLVGARVVADPTGGLELEIFEFASLRVLAGDAKTRAGWARREAVLLPGGARPAHGDPVWVQVHTSSAKGSAPALHRVTAVEPRLPGTATRPGWEPGHAYVTGRNINKKASERVFFRPRKARLPLPAEVRAAWADLIADYRAAHTHAEIFDRRDSKGNRVDPSRWLGAEPGQTGWSRHLWAEGWAELKAGSLCYARLSRHGRAVERCYPVSISRELFDVAPVDLVPASHLPAREHSEFSAADRVFGHVPEARGADRADPPYRGHVRVGPITCATDDAVERFPGGGLPLAILSAPKPRQARFYVGRGDGTAQDDGLRTDAAGYAAGKLLRGRKVYPHHSGLPADHWTDPVRRRAGGEGAQGHRWFREYRRVEAASGGARDSQNRSVAGWVKPGTEFSMSIDIDNLSDVELGALCWLLDAPAGWHLRLGGGKPLGFGSVRLALTGGQLAQGHERAARYRSLLAPVPEQDAAVVAARLRQRPTCSPWSRPGRASPTGCRSTTRGRATPSPPPTPRPSRPPRARASSGSSRTTGWTRRGRRRATRSTTSPGTGGCRRWRRRRRGRVDRGSGAYANLTSSWRGALLSLFARSRTRKPS